MAEYLKLPEVARRLDVSEKTARRYVKSGVLPSVFIGNAYRVREEDLQEYLQSARVEPGKAPRRSPSEPSFNDVLEEERREATYRPWFEFVNRYAERWERRIESGDFNEYTVNEFIRVLDELLPTLGELNKKEQAELPPQPYSHGVPAAWTGRAIHRLLDLFNPMIDAGARQLENSDLERIRKMRAELGKQAAEAG